MKAIYGVLGKEDHEVEHSKISYSTQTELNKASNNGSPHRNLYDGVLLPCSRALSCDFQVLSTERVMAYLACNGKC